MLKVFKYILRSLSNFKLLIFAQLACILLIVLDGNLKPYVIKLIIDQANNFNVNYFIFLCVLYLISQLIMVFAQSGLDWFKGLFVTNYRRLTLNKFFDTISTYRYSFFATTESGAITAKINEAFNSIPPIILVTIDGFVKFLLYTVTSLILLATIDKLFAIALLLWIFIYLTMIILFYKKNNPVNTRYAKIKPKIYGFLADYFSNILTVKLFSGYKYEKEKLLSIINEYSKTHRKMGYLITYYYTIYGIITAIYMLAILVILGYLANNNQISSGDFAFVFMINYKIIDLLYEISNYTKEFIMNIGAVENSINLLEHQDWAPADSQTHVENITRGEIEFDNISFGYDKNLPIFTELSLHIAPGETVGIVGASGSGKSSFLNLLLGLYKPNSGKIYLDGIDTNNISDKSISKAFSLVEQEPMLFHRSIYENICYGEINASKEEVIYASKQAGAHEFISGLKEEYNTIVGERGVKLSGGERQRIALARAILKNAPIFIMDEATSQLDPITENYIKNNLTKVTTDKTAIIIAHRLSTLTQVDRIIVFENGEIIEQGTHNELLNKQGVFKKLWDSQINGFILD